MARKRGRGMAACWYGIARTATVDRAAAWAEIDDGGSAKIVTGVTEIGEGILTVLAQIAAHEMGVKPEHVVIGDNDTARAPEASHAGASRQTYMIGNAVALASREARKRLVEVMAEVWDVDADVIRTGNGEIWAENTNHRITMGEAVHTAKSRGVVPVGSASFGTDTTGLDPVDGSGRPWQAYVFGARWPKSRSIPSPARCRCSASGRRTMSAARSTRKASKARSKAASCRRSARALMEDYKLDQRPHQHVGLRQIHLADLARRAACQFDHHRGSRSDRPARRQRHRRAGHGADHPGDHECDLRCGRRAHHRAAGDAGKGADGDPGQEKARSRESGTGRRISNSRTQMWRQIELGGCHEENVLGLGRTGCVDRNAQAQNYPTRPITMIVPYPAGGPSDVVARIMADGMSKALGQNIVIENVGGAGGTIGTARAAAAEHDGYTLLAASMGSHVSAPALYANLKYDSTKDFAPIGLTCKCAGGGRRAQGFPGQGLQGIRGLSEEQRRQRETGAWRRRLVLAHGLPAVHIRAGPEAQSGRLSRHRSGAQRRDRRPCRFLLRAGRQRAGCDQGRHGQSLWRVRQQPLAAVPDVPSAKEVGANDYQINIWSAIFAPKDTPKPIVDKLTTRSTRRSTIRPWPSGCSISAARCRPRRIAVRRISRASSRPISRAGIRS